MATPPASMITISGPPDLDGDFTSNFDPDSTTPDQFYFDDVTDAELSTDYEDSVTIGGIPAGSAPISITGGVYKIGSGSYTSAAGTVSNGEVVTVKVTSSDEAGEPASATLTVGDVSDVFSVTTAAASGTLIGYASFADGEIIPDSIYAGTDWSNSNSGGSMSVEAGALKQDFSADGGGPELVFNMGSLNTRQVFIEFKAKIPNANDGCKFIKIFGQNDGVNWSRVANSTFGLDYTGVTDGKGTLYYIAYGDGNGTDPQQNDTENGVNLDNPNTSLLGRAYGVTAVATNPVGHAFRAADWGDEWHHFRMMVKFNDGTTAENEIANGEYYLEIDGQVYAQASGLFNRHYSNLPIDRIGVGGYTQSNVAFDIHYDEIKISTGGFMAATTVAEFRFNDGDTMSMTKNGVYWDSPKTIEAPAGETETGARYSFGPDLDPGSDGGGEQGDFNFDDMDEVWIKRRFFIPANYVHPKNVGCQCTGDISSWQVGDTVRGTDGASTGTISYIDGQLVWLLFAQNQSWAYIGSITNTTRSSTVTATRVGDSDNNKFMSVECDGYSGGGKSPTVVLEMHSDNEFGQSTIYWHAAVNGNGTGQNPNTNGSQEPMFILTTDRGKWIETILRVKMATDETTYDGIVEFWKRTEGDSAYTKLLYDYDANIGPRAAASPPYQTFKRGYCWGWANSGFTINTLIHESEFIISAGTIDGVS